MPICVLRIAGEHFAVDEFLRDSSFRPIAIYRKGQARHSTSRRRSNTSGLNLEVGETADDIAAQSAEAVRFIRANRAELARARTYPGVERLVLDFATSFRDVIVQTERFSAELVAEAASAGMEIEISIYPVADVRAAQSVSED